MAQAKLTSKGQITIPKQVRERLNLRTGDRVEFTMEGDDRVLLRPARGSVLDLEGSLHRPGSAAVPLDEMDRVIRRRGSGER
jgi:antitoxin PrlF